MIPRSADSNAVMSPVRSPGSGFALRLAHGAAALLGGAMAGAGGWSFVDPVGFADWIQFPVHLHFLHDLGAFQIGIGVTLLLALGWRDALPVALGGFLVGNTLHAISHLRDQALGGRPTDWLWLSLASLVTLGVMVLSWRSRSPGASTGAGRPVRRAADSGAGSTRRGD